ncbi:hypothetical protein [Tropheryma whipplei]|uniref:hypothetical protein n=1 Tax=Tropheryma whipplei TaxID=2039 RepID=UPI000000C8F2|nr:hypothetical protein [Tropheryma whipplei]CAD67322.1 putative integral membrane protein [Tropheryma whipplei TW08/27]
MSKADLKKAPKYGEYATFEQQQALIQTSTELPKKSPEVAPPPPRSGGVITVALIVYIVVSNLIAFSDHPAQRILERLSYALKSSGYKPLDVNMVDYRALDYWLSFGTLVIVVGIIVLSYFRIKQRKSSFWVPLLGLLSIFAYQLFVVLVFVNRIFT